MHKNRPCIQKTSGEILKTVTKKRFEITIAITNQELKISLLRCLFLMKYFQFYGMSNNLRTLLNLFRKISGVMSSVALHRFHALASIFKKD